MMMRWWVRVVLLMRIDTRLVIGGLLSSCGGSQRCGYERFVDRGGRDYDFLNTLIEVGMVCPTEVGAMWWWCFGFGWGDMFWVG